MSSQSKISMLWIFFLFGMILDMFFPLMPLFAGSLKALPGVDVSMVGQFKTMTAVFFLIPMTVITGVILITKKWMKTVNFIMSILLSLVNIMHLAEHMGMEEVDPAVIVVLFFVFLFGIALNFVSFKWMKETEDAG